MEPKKMEKIVGGKRYNTTTATLLADNNFWNGSSFEQGGCNIFLYRTPKGAFFKITRTLWEGQHDQLRPLTREEALVTWEGLREKYVSYEQAFDAVVEEPEGRPSYYGQPMKQTAVWLPEEMTTWLKQQPGNMSETVRSLIENAMKKPN